MKYLYGDSTEFLMHIDFLRLLNNYVETGVKTIDLENAVFDLKETIMDRRRLKNSVIDEMDNFILTVENAIGGAVSRSKEQETIVKYAQKSKDFLKKFIEDGKTKFTDEIFQEIAKVVYPVFSTLHLLSQLSGRIMSGSAILQKVLRSLPG